VVVVGAGPAASAGSGVFGGNDGSTGGTGFAGEDGLGGGGGGGAQGFNGGNGGKGVVILSVPTSSYSGSVTGSPTVTISGGNTIMKFTGSGTYKLK
jgi:hypothetical protein